MSSKKVYLKQNVMVEPLFNRWYAWPNLIAPATAPMYVAFSHLAIMESFVTSPQIHISATKNPSMRGGPFMDFDLSKIDAVKALIEKTKREQSQSLEFAYAIKNFSELFLAEATGGSLEPLYIKIPDILKGYIELTYDLNTNPSIRVIEGLLYKSPNYSKSSQSVAISLTDKDERPFVFSTPKLENEDEINLNITFDNEGLDEFFKIMYQPQPVEYAEEVLGILPDQRELFRSFFTDEEPEFLPPYNEDNIRIRYFGHACILIESKHVNILCDPVISYRYENGIYRYSYSDLPDKIDYILLTHNHQDHVMLESLKKLRHKTAQIIVPKNNGGGLEDPSLRLILEAIGFRNVREIDELETIAIPGGTILGVPFFGEHGDLSIRSKISYLINVLGRSIMCAADSKNIEPKLYQHINHLYGDIDVLYLGMECDGAPLSWLYGPLLTRPISRKMDQSRRLDGSDCERGIDIVNSLNPKEVYVYAMGQEPWLDYLTSIKYTDESRPIIESNKLVEACRARGIISERLYGHKDTYLKANATNNYGAKYASKNGARPCFGERVAQGGVRS